MGSLQALDRLLALSVPSVALRIGFVMRGRRETRSPVVPVRFR
jgi:hypothetical protein